MTPQFHNLIFVEIFLFNLSEFDKLFDLEAATAFKYRLLQLFPKTTEKMNLRRKTIKITSDMELDLEK